MLTREFGLGEKANLTPLHQLARWVSQIPGMAVLRKERGRRSLLITLLVLLAIAESLGVLPVITMFSLNELPPRYLAVALGMLFIYPLIYLILAVLSIGRSVKLYRWIMWLILLAFVKDIPAFSLYFHAERWLFGLQMVIKLATLLLAFLIFRRMKNGSAVNIPDASPENPASSVPTEKTAESEA